MLLALIVLPLIIEGEAPRPAVADQPSLSKPVIPKHEGLYHEHNETANECGILDRITRISVVVRLRLNTRPPHTRCLLFRLPHCLVVPMPTVSLPEGVQTEEPLQTTDLLICDGGPSRRSG